MKQKVRFLQFWSSVWKKIHIHMDSSSKVQVICARLISSPSSDSVERLVTSVKQIQDGSDMKILEICSTRRFTRRDTSLSVMFERTTRSQRDHRGKCQGCVQDRSGQPRGLGCVQLEFDLERSPVSQSRAKDFACTANSKKKRENNLTAKISCLIQN